MRMGWCWNVSGRVLGVRSKIFQKGGYSKMKKHELSDLLSDLSKKMNTGIVDIYKESGHSAMVKELSRRYLEMRDTLIHAWFAKYGFEPGKAVLVRDGINTYIREVTPAEFDRIKAAIVIPKENSLPCDKCSPSFAMNFKYCPNCGLSLQNRAGV
jgi:hypothetical protein